MLRLLSRAVRGAPAAASRTIRPTSALESLRAAFAPIWAHAADLVFEVTDTQLTRESHPVVTELDKSGDALPWVLYKDGIRELTLLKGVEDKEIIALVQVAARVRKAAADEDDLLTLLWEQEFAFVRYRYVDVGFDSAGDVGPRRQPTSRGWWTRWPYASRESRSPRRASSAWTSSTHAVLHGRERDPAIPARGNRAVLRVRPPASTWSWSCSTCSSSSPIRRSATRSASSSTAWLVNLLASGHLRAV